MTRTGRLFNRPLPYRGAHRDADWKYVNLRGYCVSLQRSVDRGTRWPVFEPNGERLCASVAA